MGLIKNHFMERFEADPEFREAAELAELRLAEPDYPGGEDPAPEAGEAPDGGERLAA